MPETTREALHTLVDLLPEGAWDEANALLQECLEDADEDMTPYDPLEAPEVPPTPGKSPTLRNTTPSCGREKSSPFPTRKLCST